MYRQIASNNRWSFFLVLLLFGLLGAVGYFIGGFFIDAPPYWSAGAGVAIALIWFLISYYGGKRMILWASHAVKIDKGDHPVLFNVVEEMSVAAGVPVPEIYIIADTAPNAFAIGRHPGEAALAVTAGLLTKLNRDEVQGVIAHEMAHIRNYDIRLAILLAVTVGTITLICDAASRLFRSGVARSRRGRGNALFGLLALLMALLAPLFASLIRLAVSRKREFLADATGALLTRYPEGLASALEKIEADPEPLEVANRATQHLYIVNPLKARGDGEETWWNRLLSTHPPTKDRVARLRAMAGSPLPTDVRLSATYGLPVSRDGLTRPVSIPLPLLSRLGLSTNQVGTISLDAPAPSSAGLLQTEPSRKPTSLACPRCQEGLRRVRAGGKNLSACPHCGGILISRSDLRSLLERDLRSLIHLDDRLPNRIGHGWALIGRKICPQCRRPMAETTFPDLTSVPLDWCGQCDGIWFDDTELAIVAQARSAARSYEKQNFKVIDGTIRRKFSDRGRRLG